MLLNLPPTFHFNLNITSVVTRPLYDWSVTLSTFGRTNKQIQKEKNRQMVTSLLWVTTNRLIFPTPPPPPPDPSRSYISPNQNSSLPTSSIPVPLVQVCLNVCFCSLSLQKQMASSPSRIQRWSCVRVKPNACTCAPRHVFHTTNSSLLSVCLHCRAKLGPLTPVNH